MKSTLIVYAAVFCAACHSAPDRKAEEATLTRLIDNETYFAAKGDSAQWANCWVNSDDISFIYTNAEGVQSVEGFTLLARLIGDIKPFELKMKRDNYHFEINNDIAFVTFDQHDNWGGIDRHTKETRTLRKINGDWKTAHSSVVDVSSFQKPPAASYHMAVTQMAKNPRNGFQNISGLGGMSLGYMEVPGPADFTPLFEGLPGNMCNSPHWGYVIDGSLRVKYPGGKEDVVNAGEVFYWPAPHTGIVDKNVKFIDVSPDSKFIPVMDHLAKKMAAAKPQ